MDELTMEPMTESTPEPVEAPIPEPIEEPIQEAIAEPIPESSTPVCVVDVLFRSGGKVYYFDPGELEIPAGAHVIIDTARGLEFGTCAAGNHSVQASEVVTPLRPVVRIATPTDERMAEENRAKEKDAYEICLKKIEEAGLEMQLVSAEYAFDGSKILFFFTADGRVDFRDLVKSLASVFRTRIELRQIGVRDKAKMIGGLGVCGRPFCCSEFLEDFQPVSIKMAKVQNLSLNPTKISGTCGRLMCCLKYEQEAYEDLIRTSPRNESFVDTPNGRGTITEVNLLRQSVRVRMEEHPEEINSYANAEICVLRSGKGHKNDPPIPKELAPISGNREHKPRLRSTAVTPTEPMPVEEAEKPASRRRPKAPKEPREPKEVKEVKDLPAEQEKQDAARRRRPRNKPHPEGDKPQGPRSEGDKPQKPRPEGDKPQKQRSEGEKPQKPRPEGEKSQKPRPEGDRPPRPNKSHHKPKPSRPEGDRPPKAEKSAEKTAEPRPEGESRPNSGHSGHYRRRRPSGPKPEKPGEP